MTRRRAARRSLLLAGWAAWALLALATAAAVPFHPDEATFLYMSRDFDLLVLQGQPGAVGWPAEGQPALVRRYRLLDAPLGRYLAGLGRTLAGQPYLEIDWDWSATWAANGAAGAVPPPAALAAARLPAAALTALSLGLVYGVGQRLGGVGVPAALVYALSGLALLHGRRAMSEGPLLFFTALALWLLLRERPHPLWVALTLAAAIASKVTAVVLVPAAVLALVAAAGGNWRRLAGQLARFAGTLVAGLWVLHPSLWTAPLAGLRAMQAAREEFLAEQAAFIGSAAPHALLAQPGTRALAAVYHLFFAPLAYADVGQYAAHTAAAERSYAALPLHTGWHTAAISVNLVLGSLVLGLVLLGLAHAARPLWRRGRPAPASARARLIAVAWLLCATAGLLAIAVPAQRYAMLALPAICAWAGVGAAALARPVLARARRRRPAAVPTHD